MKKDAEPKPYLTVWVTAMALGVTPQTVRNWLRSGKLDRYEIDGRAVLVTRESVNRLLAERTEGKK